jgi:hypothetical protein
MEEQKSSTGDLTTKLRAAAIRKWLLVRHAVGSAVDETLSLLSDEVLIEMDDRETQKKIERIQEESGATK